MKRVLVLEDDPTILEVMEMLLREEGLVVVPAGSVEEIEAAMAEEFDVAVLDLGVAGLNIEMLIDQLRNHPSRPPVLLCSASNRLGAMVEALGVAGLAKPFNIHDFIETVWQLLRARDPSHPCA